MNDATRPQGWRAPRVRQTAYRAVIAAIGVTAFLLSLRWLPWQGSDPRWLVGTAVGFMAAERWGVRLQFRRGVHSVSLSEIPLVFALIYLDPHSAVAVRVFAGAVGLLAQPRRIRPDAYFNPAMWTVVTLVTVAVNRALNGDGIPMTPAGWGNALLAIGVGEVLALLLIAGWIGFRIDPQVWRRLPRMAFTLSITSVAALLGLTAALGLQYSGWVLALLLAGAVAVYVVSQRFVALRHGFQQVDQMYGFTRALDGTEDTSTLVQVLLREVRDQVGAQTVALVLIPAKGNTARRTILAGHQPISTDVVPISGAWWEEARQGPLILPVGVRAEGPVEAMAVPVPLADAEAVLLVTDRVNGYNSFDQDSLRLLAALANHARIALDKAHLVDRLRLEAHDREFMALHDQLTGLPNRRGLSQLFEIQLQRATGDTAPAIILLDVDRFKEINEALGHETGDAVLKGIGDRLVARIGDRGRVARLGGDEFAVLLPQVPSVAEALALAEEISQALDRPVPVGPLSLSTRASIGIAVSPMHGTDTETLLRRADTAMYAAKSARQGIRVYRSDDDQHSAHRLALIGDLRKAIQRRDLTVAFQPKVDAATGAVTGAEALSRWNHPEHGYVPPDVFISLAEQAGLVRPLTQHVLDVALRRCASWRRAGNDLHIAVNLSPTSLLDPGLADDVREMLTRHRLPARALTLEITENAIMTDPAASIRTLEELHDCGIILSIDDFGTGHSSLARLRDLPIDEMKIDKSFVLRVNDDHRDRAVVRSAIQLGHALGLNVVAEGIEDQPTYDYLANEGCDLIQGYFVARPMAADDFLGWLRGYRTRHITRHGAA